MPSAILPSTLPLKIEHEGLFFSKPLYHSDKVKRKLNSELHYLNWMRLLNLQLNKYISLSIKTTHLPVKFSFFSPLHPNPWYTHSCSLYHKGFSTRKKSWNHVKIWNLFSKYKHNGNHLFCFKPQILCSYILTSLGNSPNFPD